MKTDMHLVCYHGEGLKICLVGMIRKPPSLLHLMFTFVGGIRAYELTRSRAVSAVRGWLVGHIRRMKFQAYLHIIH